MSPTLPSVSVIVPCRNERDYIRRCLDSILATEYPKDRIEILVADGMSDDGTREIVGEYEERHAAIRLLSNPKQIVSAALNAGVRATTAEIIMRMDAHVEYPPDYIPGLIAWLRRSGADNVGAACVTRAANGGPMARAIALALAHPFGIGNARFRLGTTEPRRVDTVPFGCYRREVFQRIGLFDEELIRNQDDEFNLRLIRASGSILLVPGIVSYYYARGSLRQIARMYYQYGYFKPLVARKVGRFMTMRQVIPPLFVSSLMVAGAMAILSGAGRVALASMLGAYLVADLACSAAVGVKRGWREGLALTVTFPVLHFAYGIGFLRGMLDFFVRRRSAAVVPLSR